MVYINSKGEVVDESKLTTVNLFQRIVTFFVLFFKTLLGIEDKSNKKNDNRQPSNGPGSGGFFGGGGSGPMNDNKGGGPRKFGPRGFKSITDLSPPPPATGGCSGGVCG